MNRRLTIIVIALITLSACTKRRNLVYFSDVQQSSAFQMAIMNAHEPKIQAGDILGITVSSLDPASNAMFNTGALQSATGQIANTNTAGSTNLGKEGYLVSTGGDINFPVMGKVHMEGLTLTEAHEKLQSELLKYVKDPIVNIRYQNFKVTVIGEVNRPGTFTVANEQMTVLEALGRAGDMTGYGERENVLVIREADGKRQMERLDLTSSKVFQSPYFYLQQNDVVYVEPDDMKAVQVSRNPNTLPIVLGIISITTIIVSRFF